MQSSLLSALEHSLEASIGKCWGKELNAEDIKNILMQKSVDLQAEDQYQPKLSQPALSGTAGAEKGLSGLPDASLLLIL